MTKRKQDKTSFCYDLGLQNSQFWLKYLTILKLNCFLQLEFYRLIYRVTAYLEVFAVKMEKSIDNSKHFNGKSRTNKIEGYGGQTILLEEGH